jgi:hypothetical protein
MKALAQFEAFLESLVEGSLRRLFRGRLEPVDLGRRVGRVMDDHRRVTWGRPLVPNQYHITLAAADFEEVRGFAGSLCRELEKFVTERAAERGYDLPAPASVTITSDETLAAGTFQVRAALVDAGGMAGQGEAATPDAADFGQTRPMPPLAMPVGPTGFEALYLVGEIGGRRLAWPITGPRVSIGRGLDNDIVLEDASVSRHHAEISREGTRLEVRDLGSTNGTWVNAARVSAAAIHPGDQLAFGAVHLEVARRPVD